MAVEKTFLVDFIILNVSNSEKKVKNFIKFLEFDLERLNGLSFCIVGLIFYTFSRRLMFTFEWRDTKIKSTCSCRRLQQNMIWKDLCVPTFLIQRFWFNVFDSIFSFSSSSSFFPDTVAFRNELLSTNSPERIWKTRKIILKMHF